MCRDNFTPHVACLSSGGSSCQNKLINNQLSRATNVDYRECGKKICIQTVPVLASSYLGKRNYCRKLWDTTSGPYLVRHPGGMVLWAAILFLHGAGFVGSMTGIPGVPENITVMFLNPTSVRVSWSTSQVDQVEKYDVTYKPTDASYRMVRLVAGNSDAITLSDLQADTQYQLVITAVRGGKKYRSRPIVFRTLEPPRTSPQQDAAVTGGPIPPPPPSSQQPHAYIQVRGVEVGIVVMVLMVWAGAIALFFNRWGKIRMLLPYQPDYKEQLKVPGTGVCAAANAACNQHSNQHACSQHLHWSSHRVDSMDSTGGAGIGIIGGAAWPRSSRPRVNSAIDVAGFLSQEFLRRHGSTSRLCRKVRSADNLPLAAANQDIEQGSQDDVDRENHGFLPRRKQNSEDDERYGDSESKGPGVSTESGSKDHTDVPLIESHSHLHHSTSRDFNAGGSGGGGGSAAGSIVGRRFGGWRFGGSHEYVRCPVRQPISVDDRIYRRSCEPDFPRVPSHHSRHQHHRSADIEQHSRSCDYTRQYTIEPSIETTPTKHFGLPILSISEPSPPDEKERYDEYL